MRKSALVLAGPLSLAGCLYEDLAKSVVPEKIGLIHPRSPAINNPAGNIPR